MLISEDGTFTSIVLEIEVYDSTISGDNDLLSGFDDDLVAVGEAGDGQIYLSDEQITTMVETVRTIAQKYDEENFRTYVAGTPVITQTVKKNNDDGHEALHRIGDHNDWFLSLCHVQAPQRRYPAFTGYWWSRLP